MLRTACTVWCARATRTFPRRLPRAIARAATGRAAGGEGWGAIGAGAAEAAPPSTIAVQRPQPARAGETVEQLRSRLLYQSRKRGIRENDLLMGAFAHAHLHEWGEAELREYDVILNDHDNEWDMYAWMVGKRELPEYLAKSRVMADLVTFAKNKNREMRIDLPPLRDTTTK